MCVLSTQTRFSYHLKFPTLWNSLILFLTSLRVSTSIYSFSPLTARQSLNWSTLATTSTQPVSYIFCMLITCAVYYLVVSHARGYQIFSSLLFSLLTVIHSLSDRSENLQVHQYSLFYSNSPYAYHLFGCQSTHIARKKIWSIQTTLEN